HGAHRRSRGALRRFFVRVTAGELVAKNPGHHSRVYEAACAGSEGCGLDERAICDSAGHRLCAGSESSSVADRAVCEQGDWRTDCESRGAVDGRKKIINQKAPAV